MLRLLWTSSLGLLGLISTALAVSNPFAQVKEFTLNNGLQLYYAQLAEAKFFKLSFYVWAGSVDEKDGVDEGAAHFVEHLLFQGKDFSESDMDRAIDAVGGNHNAFTHRPFTRFFIYVPKSHWDESSALLWRVVFNDNLAADKRAAVLKVIDQENHWGEPTWIESVRDFLEPPKYLAEAGFWQNNFNLADFDRPVGGRAKYARQVTMEEAKAFHQRYYTSANMTAIYVGPHSSQVVLANLNALAKRQPGRIGGERNIRSSCDSYQKPLSSYRRCEFRDDDPDVTVGHLLNDMRFADSALITLYTEAMNRQLYELIRGGSAETYSVQRFVESWRDCGYIAFRSQASRARYSETFKLMDESIMGPLSATIPPLEFERSKKNYLRYIEERSDNPEFVEAYLSLMVREHPTHRPNSAELNWLAVIKQVTFDDLQGWSEQRLKPSQGYAFLRHPSLTIPYEILPFYLFTAIAGYFFWRRFFVNPVHLRDTRYVSRFSLWPIGWMHLLLAAWLSYRGSQHLLYPVRLALEWLLQHNLPLILSGYINVLLPPAAVVSTLMWVLRWLPQKLLITRDYVSFIAFNQHSFAIPIANIHEVAVVSAADIRRRFSARGLAKWVQPFWGRGIVVIPKHGRPVAFQVHDLDNCASKLAELLSQQESDRQITLFSLPVWNRPA